MGTHQTVLRIWASLMRAMRSLGVRSHIVLGANPVLFTMAVIAAGPSYLLEENWGAIGSWTATGTGQTYNNSSPSLPAGGSNLKQQEWSPATIWNSFTAQNEVWCYIQYQQGATLGTAGKILVVRNSSGTDLAWLRISTTGQVSVVDSSFNTATCTDTISNSTSYHFFFHYKLGSGANAQVDVGFSTDGTRPTSGNKFAGFTNGAPTTQAARIALTHQGDNIAMYWDHVLVSSSVIGDNP